MNASNWNLTHVRSHPVSDAQLMDLASICISCSGFSAISHAWHGARKFMVFSNNGMWFSISYCSSFILVPVSNLAYRAGPRGNGDWEGSDWLGGEALGGHGRPKGCLASYVFQGTWWWNAIATAFLKFIHGSSRSGSHESLPSCGDKNKSPSKWGV